MRRGLVVAGIAVLAACSSSGDPVEEEVVEEPRPERARNANLSDDGMRVETVDLNGDNRPDQWLYFDGEHLVRVERDMNFNGRVDMWQYFNSAGELVEEEMSLDPTDTVDVVIFYSNGKVTRKLMASEFDGSFPITKFYDGEERLLRVERDSTGDGQVDFWEYYEGGKRTRIGWDTSGDGQPDRFDQH